MPPPTAAEQSLSESRLGDQPFAASEAESLRLEALQLLTTAASSLQQAA
jgi:hypothetical protein